MGAAAMLYALSAQTAPREPPVVQGWGEQDGLPSRALQRTLTDHEGFLWIATSQGLARFDGRQFERFDQRNIPALAGNEICALNLTADGSLLVGSTSGTVLHGRAAGFERVAQLSQPICQLHRWADGSTLAARGALYRIDAAARVEQLMDARTAGSAVDLQVVGERAYAVAFKGRVYEILPDGQPARHWELPTQDNEGLAVHAAGDQLQVVSSRWRWSLDTRAGQVDAQVRALPLTPAALVADPTGGYYVAGRGDPTALCHLAALAAECTPIPLPTTAVTWLSVDSVGALWVSTWGDGLLRLTWPGIYAVGAAEGLRGRVRALGARRRGGLLIHTSAGLYERVDGGLRQLPAPPMDAKDVRLAVTERRDGRLLLGRRHGIDQSLDEDGSQWETISAALDPPPQGYALWIDAEDRLWTADARLLRYAQGRWTELQRDLQLSYDFVDERDGQLWVANQAGILRVDADGQLSDAGAPKPRGRFVIMSALRDSRGALWFGGYESGLYRFDGRHWLHLTQARGLPDDTAYGLAEDMRGRLWVSHGRGVYLLEPMDVERAQRSGGPVSVRALGPGDGLLATSFNGGAGKAAVRTVDGRLWFAADDAVVQIDPQRVPASIPMPGVQLAGATVDGTLVEARDRAGAVIRAPPGAQRLAWRVLAPAPGYAERVTVSTRLAPIDTQWTPLPADGRVQVERLPPGRYRIEANVAVDGRETQTLLLGEIQQAPWLWQRPWFPWLVAFAGAWAAWMVARWRTSALRRRTAQLTRLVEERSTALAAQHQALAEAQLRQRETERELDWLRLYRATEDWGHLDALTRAVYALLHAGVRQREAMAAEFALAAAKGLGMAISFTDMDQALKRLQDAGAARLEADGTWATSSPDWARLPDLAMPVSELLARTTPRIGAYRVLERIGEGAMGEVYRAVNVHDGRAVALKLVHRDTSQSPEARQRLQREGNLVATIIHPNIVRLLERGEHDGRLYLAMELVEGQTLTQRLIDQQLDATCVKRLLAELASALQTLHANGVIHRDLHPGNVMLNREGRALLLDFGLSRRLDASRMTQAPRLMGSLPYLAPELIQGQAASPASDLFALGVIAVECALGRRLWLSQETVPIMVEIAAWAGPDPALVDALPAWMCAPVARLLSPEPEARGTAGEFLATVGEP